MLSHLHVKNFALIKELSLDLKTGFSVLTGETGAGKSILIGSMNALAGARMDKNMIRTGESYALIEMVFEVDDAYIELLEKQNDILFDDEKTLVISRRFNKTGRSVYRVNGEIATSILVKKITEKMIDIHSQHDNQMLLRQDQHIFLLDRYIGNDISKLKKALKVDYDEFLKLEKKLNEGTLDKEQRKREIDFLKYEITEIEDAALKLGEDILLQDEFKLLSNRQKIIDRLSQVSYHIEGNQEGNISQLIDLVLNDINQISQYDKALSEIQQEIEQVADIVNNIRRGVLQHLSEVEMDASDLRQIEQRLDLINTLKLKYGNTIEEILELCSKKKDELAYLEHYEENIVEIKSKINDLEGKILIQCADISAMRKSASVHIANEIESILEELNFKDSQVKIEVAEKDKFDATGFDRVTILISTNKNETLQPLNKIASGGELSRVMLALKSVFAKTESVATLVFDEIDTGISGRTAQKVSEKMLGLSEYGQLICITHLPQIAAMGDQHYLIEKNEKDDRIETTVVELKENEIHEELARLIGGATITANTLSSAKEMKEQANAIKVDSIN